MRLRFDKTYESPSVCVGAVGGAQKPGSHEAGLHESRHSLTTSYVYDVNRALPVVLDDGERKYVWGLGLAYAVDGSDNPEVYHTDGLGSVRAITDGSGEVIQTYRTDEFGIPDAAGTQGSLGQPFDYTGEQRDAETGFVYLRARHYDPSIGRFVQRDTFPGFVGNPLSLNRYSYVENDPVNLTDPSGENPLLFACAGGALASVAIDVGMAWASGDKVSGSQVLRSAAGGCASGLVGFGAGALVGRVVAQAVPAATRALKVGHHACSFCEETLVETKDGPRHISDIQVGDLVLAYDEATGETGYYPVIAVHVHEDPVVLHVTIDGEVILTTPDHPFYARQTDEDGWSWIPAGELELGDRVRKGDGSSGTVEEVVSEERPRLMYNLSVQGAETFFVGGQKWLVHNTCPTPRATGAATIRSQAPSTEWGRVVQDFQLRGQEWRRVSAHAEAAMGRAYRGGTSIEEVFERGGMRLVRHRIYSPNREILHETFRPFAKFGLP